MAKIHEYFLKAIFKESEVFNEEKSITLSVNAMVKYALPMLISDKNDYSLYYEVSFKTIQDADLDEEEAYKLRQHGWMLNEDETKLIRKI